MTRNGALNPLIQDTQIGALQDREFQFLRSAIFSHAGIALSDGKRDLVQTRLRSRILELGLSGYPEYCALLQRLASDHSEWQEFTNRLTTNKTDWFREAAHFEYLINKFSPWWQVHTRKKTLRVWSAACSTGEEPYTIAMLLQDSLKSQGQHSFEVLGSDIDTKVLKIATKGIYLKSSLWQVPQQYHKLAFIPGTEDLVHLMKVRPEIKRHVTFKQLNLKVTPYSWNKDIDVVFCRNVFIYFSKEVISSILAGLYRATTDDAILFIGHSESLQGLSRWKYVGPSIYAKGRFP